MNLDYLFKDYIDLKYKVFEEKIVTTKYPILGIKIPNIRKIAKILLKEYDPDYLIKNIPKNYFEEIILLGIIISKSKGDLTTLINNYLPFIDNWAVCDIFAGNAKFIKDDLDKYFLYFNDLLKTGKEYYQRLAIVCFNNYYINDLYKDKIINTLSLIKSKDYYVLMAISWTYTTLFTYYFDDTYNYFKKNIKKIDPFIVNKTISKVKDSYKINKINKNKVIDLKLTI